ncbi:hypothetical protein GA0061071_11370 [Kosakonia oryzendophytica]|uniref:Uncharacterized protein n=1 Tax=Kosakonia oryzendophytica TaxID=1005665 RepID=A0A1C4DN04_9ENTR|nr:hypothetical protein GA0061071_11370 [Kosakonia oryzendophytica]
MKSRDGIEINYNLKELIKHEAQNAIKIASELNILFSEDFINKLQKLGVRAK